MSTAWDHELAQLLNELSVVQGELLALLNERRARLLAADSSGLDDFQQREQALIERLQACHDRRAALLEQASLEGLPGDSIRSLAQALPRSQRDKLHAPLRDTSARGRLLQHTSLANWVAVQRSLIHLAQLLEVIATGGRCQPTYESGPVAVGVSGGALLDQAA